ncbi:MULTISPECIES: hypothetical protein [unclassified Streptomyces]|uniref:hypothetical protein n=1 Tax=unclassified Streptomyces TaxID=2593676 RepID=UPI000D1C7284|nr:MULTISPECIES: hypothetical protein [unclassified Streptomyces]
MNVQVLTDPFGRLLSLIWSGTVGPCEVCRNVIEAFRWEFRGVTIDISYREPVSGIKGIVDCSEGAAVSKCGYGKAQWGGKLTSTTEMALGT